MKLSSRTASRRSPHRSPSKKGHSFKGWYTVKTGGKHQELESPALVEAFFTELPAARPDVDRISWLAAHHHTYTDIGGIDHQILLEADYLVNADEQGHSRSAIENFRRRVFRTASGTHLLDSIYLQG